MSDALTTLQPAEDGAPLSSSQLRSRLAVIQDVLKHVMVNDVDYGTIPGTQKPTLYKPGAEKLCVTFRLAADTPTIEAVPDYSGDIRYRVQVPIRAANGAILAVGIGECSTGEEKYRWRRPVHQAEYDAAAEDQKRQKWTRDGDVWEQVRVNPPDVANTVLKMAHKRAYIHAVIMATAAGAIFTQDIEDLPEGVAQSESNGERKPAVATPQRKSQAAKPANGAASVFLTRVKDISKKEGTGNKGPWTKWTITSVSGQAFGTFDTAHRDIAAEAMRTEAAVEIAYTEGKYGKDIQSIGFPEPAGEREPGADDK